MTRSARSASSATRSAIRPASGEASSHEASTLEGVVDRVFFRSESSGFSALSVCTDDGSRERACGQTPALRVGERVRLSGVFEQDKRFGRQFRFGALSVAAPSTDEGLVEALAGLVPGMGRVTTKRLVARLGGAEATIRALDSDHDAVRAAVHHAVKSASAAERAFRASLRKNAESDFTDVAGQLDASGEPNADSALFGDAVLTEWRKRRVELETDAQLASLGVPAGVRSRLMDHYEGRTLEIVRKNPYIISEEVRGIGFSTADEIARATGYVAEDDPIRARAVVRKVLSDAAENEGHTVVDRSLLLTRFLSVAPTGWTRAGEVIDQVLGLTLTRTGSGSDDEFCVRNAGNLSQVQGTLVSLPHLTADEEEIAWRVLDLHGDDDHAGRWGLDEVLSVVSEHLSAMDADPNSITLSPSQRAAIREVAGRHVSVLTGGPGTGKTTIVRTLREVYLRMGLRVVLCAPTGRAARRMAEACGCSAHTIHRLLEWGPSTGACDENGDGDGLGFQRDEKPPLDADLVVCDECSMMDVTLMAALLRSVKRGGRVILVGDADQLPPVGPGAPFRDIIASGAVSVAKLTEIHRQAARSAIVRASHAIREGKSFEPSPLGDRSDGVIFVVERGSAAEIQKEIVSVVSKQAPRAFGASPTTDVQVIVPMRKHETGTEDLNLALQEALNPRRDGEDEVVRSGQSFRARDRVMQTTNNYGLGVMNGQIGVVLAVRAPSTSDPGQIAALRVDFGGDLVVEYQEREVSQLQHAYACTCHKMQGSQAKVVVVGLSRPHWFMLNRTLLYTAVTRAERACIIVCDRGSLSRAVRNKANSHRITALEGLLRSGPARNASGPARDAQG